MMRSLGRVIAGVVQGYQRSFGYVAMLSVQDSRVPSYGNSEIVLHIVTTYICIHIYAYVC